MISSACKARLRRSKGATSGSRPISARMVAQVLHCCSLSEASASPTGPLSRCICTRWFAPYMSQIAAMASRAHRFIWEMRTLNVFSPSLSSPSRRAPMMYKWLPSNMPAAKSLATNAVVLMFR
ncbi:hypothetical protein B0I35DRAFT_420359 [Stachybotrys elegans]|uniref:Uncharacterized protein n=1 Tax=Stachybotrys elegans TaxID=80388 RepID=A0A8K0T7I3_9HYPO|nr:hypothetical protein B0I35DRAFT_420359 [Stachybotrys elegans]